LATAPRIWVVYIKDLSGTPLKKKFGPFLMAFAVLIVGCSKDPFVNSNNGTFNDSRDNHDYKWVRIGEQVWMAENLAYLPSMSPSSSGSDSALYYYVHGYEGNSVSEAEATANYTTYGVLYNWEAAKTDCPSGWHLPSDAEWTTLKDYLGTYTGGKMKEIGTAHWFSPNTSATNESIFTALPSGGRGGFGGFTYLGDYASFWSSSANGSLGAWSRCLHYDSDGVYRNNSYHSYGFSTRCLQK